MVRNAASYAADGGLGLLMMHFHNANGNKGQVVNLLDPSTTSLTASPDPATEGLPTTLTATVTGSGAAVPTGTVTFTDGTTQVGTAPLAGDGRATLVYRPSRAGTRTLAVAYAGDDHYSSGWSSPVRYRVVGPA